MTMAHSNARANAYRLTVYFLFIASVVAAIWFGFVGISDMAAEDRAEDRELEQEMFAELATCHDINCRARAIEYYEFKSGSNGNGYETLGALLFVFCLASLIAAIVWGISIYGRW